MAPVQAVDLLGMSVANVLVGHVGFLEMNKPNSFTINIQDSAPKNFSSVVEAVHTYSNVVDSNVVVASHGQKALVVLVPGQAARIAFFKRTEIRQTIIKTSARST